MLNQYRMSSLDPIAQVILDGLASMIGQDETDRVIDKAQCSSTDAASSQSLSLPQIEFALEALYGKMGGRGIAFRTGQVTFGCMLRRFGNEMGFNSLEYHLMPSTLRITRGLEELANQFSKMFPCQIELEENQNAWTLHLSSVGGCQGQSPQNIQSCSQFFIGILNEYLLWTAGKSFSILEPEGPFPQENDCKIQIAKQASC